MSLFKHDPQFGDIVDFDSIRPTLKETYDLLLPEYNMLEAIQTGTKTFDDHPSLMIAAGASVLAWEMLLAAEEYEIAEELKHGIFTLGWTEEHVGSDLLSMNTQATPISDDPDEREFHVKGRKWLINNSYHADYHMILAKIDPEQDGPRSMSVFLVPRSSTKNWERLETHVLRDMVLTTFEIDGPGRLIGKRGHGLSIVQKMAMPSKYQCAYVGNQMVRNALTATLDHLSTKTIFKEQPINFSNVFRQMYNLVLQGSFLDFLYHRAVALSDSSFLQFHGTILKSFHLLRANEVLAQNLLVAGSKGFLKESIIGRDAFDSFVLPVFDGHYTINTLMTAKHMPRYLGAERKENMEERLAFLRERLFDPQPGRQIEMSPAEIRRPDFFNYADYWSQLGVPLAINIEDLLAQVQTLLDELDAKHYAAEPEYKYKTGMLLHWLEALLASAEFWKLYGDLYLNVVVQQYNGFTKIFNDIISEGVLDTSFLTPLHHVPLPEVEDNETFLRNLLNVRLLNHEPAVGD